MRKNMTDYTALIENSPAWAALSGNIAGGNISHAYLLSGSDALALDALGTMFARKICRPSDITYLPAAAPRSALHASQSKVLTEDINRLVSEAALLPFDGDRKAYVVRRAETMTDQAQNKLLKTLEEPPPSVVIVLCCAGEERLLRTVRSRTRKIAVNPFSYDEIYGCLVKNGAAGETASFAAALSGGSLAAADGIINDPRLPALYGLVMRVFSEMKKSADLLPFSAALAREKEYAGVILDYFLYAARDIMAAASGARKLILTKSRENDIMEISRGYTPGAAAVIIERINYAKKRLQFNCNLQSVIDELLFAILEAKSKA